ncbi:MAG: hypothetical protein IT364_11980 [Candidatus Hydrogenedentes bacterium]|nr:hypothetical protein [Candidatus Hydrogenedentota bacterium]
MTVRLDAGGERRITLPEGTGAFDVADLDADGLSEILAIRGDDLLEVDTLTSTSTEGLPRVLFKANSLYSAPSADPFPQVLVATFNLQLCVILPVSGALRAYSIEGTLLEEFPVSAANSAVPALREGVDAVSLTRPGTAPSGETWLKCYQTIEMAPNLPAELAPAPVSHFTTWSASHEVAAPEDEGGLPAGMEEGEYAGMWDCSSLQEDAARMRLLMCRTDDTGNSLVFLYDVPLISGELNWAEAKRSPIRKYPGRVVRSDFEPDIEYSQRADFNGDGYVDLVLADAPRPGTSVDSLVRTVLGRTWPLRLTVHLFVPEKERFDPKPFGVIDCKVPVTWFFGREPLRNVCIADFDGDKMTDLGFSAEESEFQVWLAADGFGDQPDWSYKFPGPIERIETVADVAGNGRMSVLLRCERTLFLLRAP